MRKMKFLQGLDPDLQQALLIKLRNLWTHTSTAIEGNTLTLGETAFVLQEGLTIGGKPLKDHQEVLGHARAIDLLYNILETGHRFSVADLFALHRAVQTDILIDIYNPVGDWKKEQNSTVGVVNDRQIIFEYARPEDVPELMKKWFDLFYQYEQKLQHETRRESFVKAYAYLHVAFVRIHPFFDGNGRLARLVSNLPILRAGLPPILIDRAKRRYYLELLMMYHLQVGQIKADSELLPQPEKLEPFIRFCHESWQETWQLVEEVYRIQQKRNKSLL